MKKTIKLLILIILINFNFNVNAQSSETYYNAGVALKLKNKSAEALSEFKKAVADDPSLTKAYYEIGWCYNDLKEYSNAIKFLQVARKEWADVPKVYFELGYAFQLLRQNDSAKANYNQCLKLKNDYKLVYKQLGNLAYDESQYVNAITNFNTYINLTTGSSIDHLVWYRKGYCYNALKQYDSAIVALNNALKINNKYLNTYLELGFAETKLKKNNQKAFDYFYQAILLDKSSHIAFNGIGELYRDNIKNYDSAIIWYKKVIDYKPNERKANYGIGYCLNAQRKYMEAIPYLEKAIEQEKDYIAAYIDLGYSNYKIKNYNIAETNFNIALKLNDKSQNAMYYKSLLLIDLDRKDEAQKVINNLKNINAQLASQLQVKLK